jgi:DNA-directed RNA polymerase specialized sigma24 family protein
MTPEQIITEALDNHESLLIGYAREITGELESAKDAVQETFLRLSRQDLDVWRPRLRPWLFVVCRNCALDHVRKIVKFSADPVENHERSSQEMAAAASIAVLLRVNIRRKFSGCQQPAPNGDVSLIADEGGFIFGKV